MRYPRNAAPRDGLQPNFLLSGDNHLNDSIFEGLEIESRDFPVAQSWWAFLSTAGRNRHGVAMTDDEEAVNETERENWEP